MAPVDQLTQREIDLIPGHISKWGDVMYATGSLTPEERKKAESLIIEIYGQIQKEFYSSYSTPLIVWGLSPRDVLNKKVDLEVIKNFSSGDRIKRLYRKLYEFAHNRVRNFYIKNYTDRERRQPHDFVLYRLPQIFEQHYHLGNGKAVEVYLQQYIQRTFPKSLYIQMRRYISDGLFGTWNANQFVALDFFREVMGFKEETEVASSLLELHKMVWGIVPYEQVCYVVEKPVYIRLDSEGKLNCAWGPALGYEDAFYIYANHGNCYDKESALKNIVTKCKRSLKVTLENLLKVKIENFNA
jgi:uncharacterized protein (DUF2132 family)